jgi:hypothetical protein
MSVRATVRDQTMDFNTRQEAYKWIDEECERTGAIGGSIKEVL